MVFGGCLMGLWWLGEVGFKVEGARVVVNSCGIWFVALD